MTSAADITGPLAALLAGLVTSLHCVGMCGPLSCSACTKSGGQGSLAAAFLYHGSRLISYGLVGMAAGLTGRRLADALSGGATRWMAWVFILFFLAVAVGLDKRLRVPIPQGAQAWLGARTSGHGVLGRAGLLGFFTPLLPCAPLYLVIMAAALSGSAWNGTAVMVAFAIGTIPLLLLLQSQFFRLGSVWSPRTMDYLRRGLALASVGILLLRGTYSAATGCPMCH